MKRTCKEAMQELKYKVMLATDYSIDKNMRRGVLDQIFRAIEEYEMDVRKDEQDKTWERFKTALMNGSIELYDLEEFKSVSNCCGVPMNTNDKICSNCKEHAEVVRGGD
jgi:hypothetical protein